MVASVCIAFLFRNVGSGGLVATSPSCPLCFWVYFSACTHLSLICCVIFVFAGRLLNFFMMGVTLYSCEKRQSFNPLPSSLPLCTVVLCRELPMLPLTCCALGPASHSFHPQLCTHFQVLIDTQISKNPLALRRC